MRFKEDVENPMVLEQYDYNRRTMNDDYFTDVFDENEYEDDEVRCKVCGSLQFKEEAAPSQIWEDTWICEEKECIEAHHTGWSESMSLQKYYIKKEKAFMGK